MGSLSDGAGDTVYRKFTTRAFSTGVPTTLGGTPAISVYKDASATQSIAGVTLTADFDSVTGLNHVSIDTSADGTFYANGSHFELVITTGTVGGTSVVGEVVGSFDLKASIGSATGGVNVTQIAGQTASAAGTVTFPGTIASTTNITAGTMTTTTNLTNLPTAPTDWLTAAAVKADAVTKIQAGLATPTNITAGTLTTVTNLTNLPTIPANWLTAAGIATDAGTEIAVAVDAVLSFIHGSGAWGAGSAGPTAEEIATAVWQDATEGDFTVVGSVGELVFGQPTAEEVAVIVDTQLTGTHGSGSWLTGTAAISDVDLAAIADAVWDEVNTAADHNVANSTGKQLRTVGGNTTAIYTSSPIPDQTGMTSTQVKLDPGASSSDGAYEGAAVWGTFGTGQGGGICTNYVGSTRVATINVAWDVQPVEGDAVEVTPSGYAIVAGYIAGKDPATLVWAAATRTLTDLPAMPTDWVTADGVSADAVTKIQAGLSTYTGTAADEGINTLLGRLTGPRAVLLDNLVLLDRAISTRSTYSGGDTAGTTTLLARLTLPRAVLLDNLANLDATVSTRATPAQAADKILGRNIAGGSDGGRTVTEAMQFLRNKWVIASSTLTVYENDDSTPSWTAAVATTASNPVTGVDPA